jgi:phospholipase/carboxylesterase
MSASPDKIEAPLHYEVAPPSQPGSAHPTLVLLHGRGANAADLLPLAPELVGDDWLTLAPQAPYELRGVFGLGYAWYHFKENGHPKQPGFDQALDRLAGFLEAIRQGYAIHPERLFLLGFSQGAVVSLAAALQGLDRVAGVVALSGYLAESVTLAGDAGRSAPPVFMGHGTLDDLIPVEAGRQTRDWLTAHGVEVSYREYSAGHGITPDEVEHIRTWLADRAGPSE